MALTNSKKYESLMISHCSFLFENYTNIFNRLMKDELNLNILFTFIETLREVEDGVLDQHEASVKIGKILKELYVDSAMKREKKIDAKNQTTTTKYKKPANNISWAKFKAAGLNIN